MKAPKFTPGPWETRNMGDENLFPSVVIGKYTGIRYSDGSGTDTSIMEAHRIIVTAGAAPEWLARGVHHNALSVCRANARLIAAAPELYDMVRELLDAHYHAVNCGFDEQAAADERELAARHAARALLAKAA